MKLALSVIFGILLWANVLTDEASGQGVATFYSGSDLLQMCTGPGHIGCYAYIAGVSDAIASQRAYEGKPACLDSSVQVGQVVSVALDYLRAHPESRAFNAAFLIKEAITLAWRC